MGDTSEMRDARCEREREPAGAARRRRNEIHGRRSAARWRSGGPGMRLWRRLERLCAGGSKACRHRHRLPGGGCRLSWDVGALSSGPERKALGPQQSPAARANSPSAADLRGVGTRRFLVGSTTSKVQRGKLLPPEQLSKLGPTRGPSTRESCRGRGRWGGRPGNATSAGAVR